MRDSRPKRSSAGFTLLELLIVMVAIAIVASFAIPSWFEREVVTLDNAAKLLARDLRDAQNWATSVGEPIRVVFREDGEGYAVVKQDGQPIPGPVGGGAFVRTYSKDAIFEGVRIAKMSLGDDRTILYDDRGFAKGAGSLVLLFRDDARVVEVEEESGMIEVKGLSEAWVDTGR